MPGGKGEEGGRGGLQRQWQLALPARPLPQPLPPPMPQQPQQILLLARPLSLPDTRGQEADTAMPVGEAVPPGCPSRESSAEVACHRARVR